MFTGSSIVHTAIEGTSPMPGVSPYVCSSMRYWSGEELGPVKTRVVSVELSRRLVTSSGRASAYRSNSRSLRARIMSLDTKRAMGAIAPALRVFSAIRRSISETRSAAPSVPRGISSRATVGRSVKPGRIGSMVPPQRYEAKSLPGVSHTL